MTKYLKPALVLLIGGALAYWFIARTDWSVVGERIRHAKLWPLVLGIVIINLTMLARALRWQVLLAPIARVSLRNSFAATAIGFGAVFVIGRAGEVVRPVALSLRERLRPSATLATILIERIFDTAAVVGLFSVNLLFFQMPQQDATSQNSMTLLRTLGATLSIGVIVGIIALVLLRLRAEPLLHWLEARTTALPQKLMRPVLNLLRALAEGLSVLTGARALLLAVAYSACVWSLVTLATWLVTYAFGLDLPLTQQYVSYWKGLVRGDFGQSLVSSEDVFAKIISRYPATMELAFAGLVVAILIAIPLGVTAGTNQGKLIDNVASVVSLLGISAPGFVLGPLMVYVFAVKLNWLPVGGRDGFETLILPALTLGAALAAILTRMVRSSVIEELGEDYVRTARAKGLSERQVIYKHVLKNGLIPVVTVLGLQFGVLLAGAIITETIFSWPGLGRMTVDAINARDYPVVQGCILMIALTYIVANVLTDFTYRLLDPRIKVE